MQLIHQYFRSPNVTLPVLPPKKFFGNTDKSFVNDRKVALQVRLILSSLPVLSN